MMRTSSNLRKQACVKLGKLRLFLLLAVLGSVLGTVGLRLLFLQKPLLKLVSYSITLNLYWHFKKQAHKLILEIGPYIEELTKTRGAIQEFVNPEYKDATKTSFKSSTRLECMMQDYAKMLPPSARVGFTVMETMFACAPVENNAEDAVKHTFIDAGLGWRSELSKVYIWYASYGPSMWKPVFDCYINGGKVVKQVQNMHPKGFNCSSRRIQSLARDPIALEFYVSNCIK